MKLEETKKSDILNVFKAMYEIQEQISNLKGALSDSKKMLAEQLGIKKEIITKAYSTWLLTIEAPEKYQDIEDLVEFIL